MVAVDETLYAQEPSTEKKEECEEKGDPIPLMFIQIKPHQLGFLSYQACVALKVNERKYPFVIDFEPFFTHPMTSAQDSIRKFMERWPFNNNNKPHFVADRAFGSWELINEVKQWGGIATLAFPSGTCGEVWNLLVHNLPLDCWRASEKEGIVQFAKHFRKITFDFHVV
jgi:hypothetical protein